MQKKQTRKNLRASELIVKYLRDTITTAEQSELEQWVGNTEGSGRFMQEITKSENLKQDLEALGQTRTEEKWEQLLDKVIAKEKAGSIRLKRATWLSAAAVLLVAVASWILVPKILENRTEMTPKLASKYGSDVLPGNQKAALILSDGRSIALQTASDSSFSEAGSGVQRTANGLLYRQKINGDTPMVWNTLRISNGGEYMVTLADGTRVWLNAASSLHYPVQFTGNERKVELTGEAYFEVAKNKEKPFIVNAKKMDVLAVGTAFNVNSYDNADSATITTLEEGRIKVTTKFKTVLLEPGQQVKADSKTTAISGGDVEAATAWKNGLFQFNNTPLTEVMQQLKRWYDVQVTYDTHFKLPKLFTGEIKRNVPVSKLLEMMEMTGIATFKIERNTITILPYNR